LSDLGVKGTPIINDLKEIICEWFGFVSQDRAQWFAPEEAGSFLNS
jgi:hypothetical protein